MGVDIHLDSGEDTLLRSQVRGYRMGEMPGVGLVKSQLKLNRNIVNRYIQIGSLRKSLSVQCVGSP